MAGKPHLTPVFTSWSRDGGKRDFFVWQYKYWLKAMLGQRGSQVWNLIHPSSFSLLWSKVLISSVRRRSPSPQSKWNETFSNIFFLIWISNTRNKEGPYYRDSFLNFQIISSWKKYTSAFKSVDKTKWKQMIAFQVLMRALSNTNWIRKCFCVTAGAPSIPLHTKLAGYERWE